MTYTFEIIQTRKENSSLIRTDWYPSEPKTNKMTIESENAQPLPDEILCAIDELYPA